MRKRLAIAGMVAALAATISLSGGKLRSTPASASPGGTAALVAALEEKTRREAKDARAHVELGLAYQQLTRETGEAAYYPRSEQALRRALALQPRNATALGALGSLALARHDFRGALAYGKRAVRLAPYSALHHGVVGDALTELGRYDEAFAAFDRMVELRPSSPAYARVSYARELLGRPQRAEEAMRLALESAAGHEERTAWVLAHLGKLALSQGKTAIAAPRFRSALKVSPGYGPAFEGLGHIEAARGRLALAIVFMKRAGAAEALGDLYRLTGREALAQAAYRDAFAALRYETRYGVHMSLDLATFQVDRGIRLKEALALARRGYDDRPSVVGDDALGWALVRTGRCREALPFARRALRLGTRDASWTFHLAMAERCVGNHARAERLFDRALAINPHFSILWSSVARRYAAAYDS